MLPSTDLSLFLLSDETLVGTIILDKLLSSTYQLYDSDLIPS